MPKTDPPDLGDPDDAAFVAGWLGERKEHLVELDPDREICGEAALNAMESELSSWFELPVEPEQESRP